MSAAKSLVAVVQLESPLSVIVKMLSAIAIPAISTGTSA